MSVYVQQYVPRNKAFTGKVKVYPDTMPSEVEKALEQVFGAEVASVRNQTVANVRSVTTLNLTPDNRHASTNLW